ncbi:hypothetical protein QNA08_15335 [Chelatococcus sp. SYSU_G07232]|uniref:Uncharacterized protein n=2 Tax=Chelatococcus albus TaxID=3047466 RepID=A0ABT7AJP0_9HYPH|nr:hypothetical protein [Chelatococcus sp. SYSU_G07232]
MRRVATLLVTTLALAGVVDAAAAQTRQKPRGQAAQENYFDQPGVLPAYPAPQRARGDVDAAPTRDDRFGRDVLPPAIGGGKSAIGNIDLNPPRQ